MSSEHIGQTHGEFSVWHYSKDGDQVCGRRWVGPQEAVEAAHHFCTSVAAKMGWTVRVIITDGGDFTNFEWKYGEGITFK
jgi:hypothetical protein